MVSRPGGVDDAPDREVLRAGRRAPAERPVVLTAGPATALLDGADLRHVRAGGAELVQRVYVAVRDEPWNTIPGVQADLVIARGRDSFRVTFSMRHRHETIDFAWDATITGDPDGTIRYAVDGVCHGSFRYNKIGLNVHHALESSIGRAYRARTAAGELRGVLPHGIEPQRVVDGTITGMFAPYDELAIEVADGVEAIVGIEGDLLELQDHRNWADGNLKSYATPLALGFPFTSADGTRIRQVLTIRHRGVVPPARTADPELRVGAALGRPLPAIGLGAPSHEDALDARSAAQLRALSPAHLRVDLPMRPGAWEAPLERAIADAAVLGCPLELAVAAGDAAGPELARLAARLAAAGIPVARVHVLALADGFSAAAGATPPATVARVRAALAPVTGPVVYAGGTSQSFVDVNRDRPADPVITGIGFSACPTIHAADDASIIENIVGVEAVVRHAREIGEGRSIHVGPITLATRFGPYPAGPAFPGDLPPPVDPRQLSLLGAAWTVGAIGALAAGGADSATLYETTGWRGVVAGPAASPMPDRFPSIPGQVFPLYHVLADLAAWRHGTVHALTTSAPLTAVGIAVSVDGTIGVLVANVTPEAQRVHLAGLTGGSADVRILDDGSAVEALTDPDGFRASAGARRVLRDGGLWIALPPYAVARVIAGG